MDGAQTVPLVFWGYTITAYLPLMLTEKLLFSSSESPSHCAYMYQHASHISDDSVVNNPILLNGFSVLIKERELLTPFNIAQGSHTSHKVTATFVCPQSSNQVLSWVREMPLHRHHLVEMVRLWLSHSKEWAFIIMAGLALLLLPGGHEWQPPPPLCCVSSVVDQLLWLWQRVIRWKIFHNVLLCG